MAKDMVVRLIMQAEQFQRESKKATESLKSIEGSANSLTRALGVMKNAALVASAAWATMGLGRVAADIIEVGIAYDRLGRAMTAAHGSQVEAASATKFLMDESKRLGLVFRDQVEAYKQLAAASRGTALEGEGVRKVYSALAEAATALQMNQQQVGLAIYAVQQMMSKGVVSSEELRRQLGDVLPGAFQIAARAMGVTTEELNKMLESGKIMSDQFIPKFAEQLRKEFGESAVESAKSAASEINRLKTSFEELEHTLAIQVLPTFTAIVKMLNEMAQPRKIAGAIGEGLVTEAGIYATSLREGNEISRRLASGEQQEASRRWAYGLGKYNVPSEKEINESLKKAIDEETKFQAIVFKNQQDRIKQNQKEAKEAERQREKWIDTYLDGVDKAWDAEVKRNQGIGELVNVEMKWANDKFEEEKKLAEKLAEKQLREQEKALEKQIKEWEHFWERVQDTTADVLYDIFNGTVSSWEDMLDRMKQLFWKWVSEIAAQQIILNIRGAFGASGGGTDIISSIGSVFGLGGSSSGLFSLSNLSSVASLGSSASGYNMTSLSGLTAGAGAWGSGSTAAITAGASGYVPAGASAASIGAGAGLGWAALPLAVPLIGKVLKTLFFGNSTEGEQLNASYINKQMSEQKWTKGTGLNALSLSSRKFPLADWQQSAVNAYVSSANQIAQVFNQQMLAFISMLPQEIGEKLEQRLQEINWGANISGWWTPDNAQSEINKSIQSLVDTYASIWTTISKKSADEMMLLLPKYSEAKQLEAILRPSWEQFVMGLRTSDLAPVQSMETFSSYYRQLMDKVRANPSDTNAINQLMQYTSGTYLPFVKSYTGEGSDYAGIFNQIVTSSGELYNTVFSTIDSINKQFDELFDYMKELLDRPINVTVALNGTTIANAVAVAVDQGNVTGVDRTWDNVIIPTSTNTPTNYYDDPSSTPTWRGYGP